MKDDQTNKLPGTQGSGSPPSDDRIDFIVSAVQSLAVSMETVKEDIKELKIGLQDAVSRIAELEQAAQERALDTKPIWERALVEILEIRKGVEDINRKLDVLNQDVLQVRADQRRVEKRMDELTSRAQ